MSDMEAIDISGANAGRSVLIEALEDDHLLITATTTGGTTRLLGAVRWEGRTIFLEGVHLEGPGPNQVGYRELHAVSQEILIAADADSIIIYGGRRTSGANPGRRPRKITYHRKL